MVTIVLVAIMIVMPSCKKDTLQPNWLTKWLYKETMFLVATDNVAGNNYTQTENARKTVEEFFEWSDGHIINMWGPVAYDTIAHKCTWDHQVAYEQEIMPNPSDTGNFSPESAMTKLIKKFSDEAWDRGAGKAIKKLKICIPKRLYDLHPYSYERILSKVIPYLKDVVWGDPSNSNGTRDWYYEKDISDLFTADDADYKDPWKCNCSMKTYHFDAYRNYSDGNNKKGKRTNKEVAEYIASKGLLDYVECSYRNYSDENKNKETEKTDEEISEAIKVAIAKLQYIESEKRYSSIKNLKVGNYMIQPEDLKTKSGSMNGKEVYYVEIIY